jgi:hypothetical protein
MLCDDLWILKGIVVPFDLKTLKISFTRINSFKNAPTQINPGRGRPN